MIEKLLNEFYNIFFGYDERNQEFRILEMDRILQQIFQ